MLKCDHSRSSCFDHVADKNVFLSVSHLLNSFSRNGSSCHVQVLSCRIFPDYIYDKLCFLSDMSGIFSYLLVNACSARLVLFQLVSAYSFSQNIIESAETRTSRYTVILCTSRLSTSSSVIFFYT